MHVSLRDSTGRNAFAVSDVELQTGRSGAAYEDTKFMSEEGEWFLAGVLDGIADGALSPPTQLVFLPFMPMVNGSITASDAHGQARSLLTRHLKLTH